MRRLLGRASERRAAQRFVIEGPTALADALAADATVEAVYVAPNGAHLPAVDAARERGIHVASLQPGVIERIADAVTPQPVLAVAHTLDVPLERLRGADFLMICVDVRDPGNAGTLLRSAQAAGAGGVVCCGGTVDLFNPKTVRASAGAIFNVDVALGGEAVDVLTTVGSWGLCRLAADPHDGLVYTEADLTGPLALVLGNETAGLAAELEAALDGHVRIPLHASAESLNVAMAGTVLCFEAARQRAAAGMATAGGEP